MSKFPLPTRNSWNSLFSRGGASALLQVGASVVLIAAAIAGYSSPETREQPVGNKVRNGMADRLALSQAEAMARCEQLHAAWTREHANDGSDALGSNGRVELALARCERGDVANGSIELEQLFRQYGIVAPPPPAPPVVVTR
jgi:hypothetical protein